MRLSREKTHGVVADAVIYFLYDGMKMFFSLLTHKPTVLDYTIRNGTLAIFPLTPAFTVTGLGNPGRAFINSHGKNMAECLEFISVHRVMAA